MTSWLDEDTNGGPDSARCDRCGRIENAIGRCDCDDEEPPETFQQARAFIVTASTAELRRMRRALLIYGLPTTDLDTIIKQREGEEP